jgi:hypothetical protein
MRRLFWLAMGITIGALVVRKLSQAADRLTPQSVAGNLADGLRELAAAIGDFGAEVRAGMAEREQELRAGTGLDAPLPDRSTSPVPHRRGAHAADS